MKTTTKTFVICERCDQPIEEESQGVVINGNIVSANAEGPCGIIGEGQWVQKESVRPNEIFKAGYHVGCLFRAICDAYGYSSSTIRSMVEGVAHDR